MSSKWAPRRPSPPDNRRKNLIISLVFGAGAGLLIAALMFGLVVAYSFSESRVHAQSLPGDTEVIRAATFSNLVQTGYFTVFVLYDIPPNRWCGALAPDASGVKDCFSNIGELKPGALTLVYSNDCSSTTTCNDDISLAIGVPYLGTGIAAFHFPIGEFEIGEEKVCLVAGPGFLQSNVNKPCVAVEANGLIRDPEVQREAFEEFLPSFLADFSSRAGIIAGEIVNTDSFVLTRAGLNYLRLVLPNIEQVFPELLPSSFEDLGDLEELGFDDFTAGQVANPGLFRELQRQNQELVTPAQANAAQLGIEDYELWVWAICSLISIVVGGFLWVKYNRNLALIFVYAVYILGAFWSPRMLVPIFLLSIILLIVAWQKWQRRGLSI